MNLWMSSEAMAGIDKDVRKIRRAIEAQVNSNLDPSDIKELEKWILVVIMVPKNIDETFQEEIPNRKKNNRIGFKLKIDHEEFRNSNEEKKLKLVFDCLSRSLDLMSKTDVSSEVQAKLRSAVAEARRSLTA